MEIPYTLARQRSELQECHRNLTVPGCSLPDVFGDRNRFHNPLMLSKLYRKNVMIHIDFHLALVQDTCFSTSVERCSINIKYINKKEDARC